MSERVECCFSFLNAGVEDEEEEEEEGQAVNNNYRDYG